MLASSRLRALVVRDYPWSTEPQFTVCRVGLLRSHPREVSRLSAQGNACTPIHPMTAWRLLPPASLTGSAIPRACASATPGAYALHRPRERIRLTTFREFHPQVG